MTDRISVVRGGRLIDGTGHSPIDDSVILIAGTRIAAVGRRGEIPVPSDAHVIDAAGKTVLPGFIDGHGHLEDFHGELYLHLGITTCATIGILQDGPWTRAQKIGTELGQIRGPRIWFSGRAIGGKSTHANKPSGRATRTTILAETADEARNAVRRKQELGCDLIKVDEFLPADILRAVVEEAHSLGLAVTCHSLDAIKSANAGVDAIEHIWSVGYSSMLYEPSRRVLAVDRLADLIEQEIAGSYYEPENYGPIIDAMVRNKVAFTPTIAKWLRPLSRYADRFRAREDEILNHSGAALPASVRAVTENAYEKLYRRYSPEKLERARIGYQKANEFIRRFVEAGGILKEGSDPPRGMAALLMHQSLAMDVEIGVPPLVAIQSATLNVAKAFRKDKDYGSVEPGKIADLSIVEGDPLEDIWATQNVKMVIMNGEVIDIGFTRYKNPIPSFYSFQTLSTDIEISPSFVEQGDGPITLRVRGRGMWPFHRVMLNPEFGSLLQLSSIELPTRYVSKTELEADIAPELLARPGNYAITVKSHGEPLPESHRAHLIVSFRRREHVEAGSPSGRTPRS